LNDVAKATPDGYMLLVSDASCDGAALQAIGRSIRSRPARDCAICDGPHIVVVNPSLQAKSLGELIALGQAVARHPEFRFGGGGLAAASCRRGRFGCGKPASPGRTFPLRARGRQSSA